MHDPISTTRLALLPAALLLALAVPLGGAAVHGIALPGAASSGASSDGGDEQGKFIPLRDGEILVGEVADHDEEGLEVKRLDNGGIVRLRWTQLAPPFEQALRAEFGYVDLTSDEILVEVDELVLRDGSRRVGTILESGDQGILLKEKNSTLLYTREMLDGEPGRVRIPALDVYTREELYRDELGRHDLTTALGHLELARYLEKISDFEHAMEHYRKVSELEPAKHAGEVSSALARCEQRKARQDEIDYLAEIQVQRVRRKWDLALQLCAEFPAKFPRSDARTREDVEKRKANIETSKHADYVKRVHERYHERVERRIRDKSLDRKLGLSAAVAWVNREARKEVVAAVAAILSKESAEFTEANVQKLWTERNADPKTRPRVRQVSYGNATFTLGKQKAKDGVSNLLSVTGAPGAAGPVKSQEEKDLEAKMKRLLERQGGGSGNNQGAKKPETAEEWYLRAPSFERYQFLLSTYVENAGDMEIVDRLARPCGTCGGRGYYETFTTGQAEPTVSVGGRSGGGNSGGGGSGLVQVECPTCHGVQVQRMLRYR